MTGLSHPPGLVVLTSAPSQGGELSQLCANWADFIQIMSQPSISSLKSQDEAKPARPGRPGNALPNPSLGFCGLRGR